MPDLVGGIPFGIDNAKISGRSNAGVLASTKVDIFGTTALSLSTESDEQEARGDNVARRITRSNKSVTGSLGFLQHDPALLAALGDGLMTTSGTTPAVITTYAEPEKPAQKKYQLEGQAYDGASATRLTVLNATTTGGPNFDWSTDSYSEVGIDFRGSGFLDSGSLIMYKVQVYETGVPISGTNP